MSRSQASIVSSTSLLIAVVAVATISAPARAQGGARSGAQGDTHPAAQAVAGRWKATFDSDIRVERDTFIVNKRSGATLVLEARGDSVFGTWNDDGPAPELQLRGTYDGRMLELAADARDRTVRHNGEPIRMVVRSEWTGRLEGNHLRGVMLIHLGDRPAFPRRWDATRE